MYDVCVWSLKLEIGFLPLFLRSFVALCCFFGLSRSDGLVFRHLVLRRAAARIVALVLLWYVGGLLPSVDYNLNMLYV